MASHTSSRGGSRVMVDKNVSIKGASDEQLDALLSRIRKESELQMIIEGIKRRSSTEFQPYDAPAGISMDMPVSSLYHYGVLGMHWGRRKSAAKERYKAGLKKSSDRFQRDIKKMSDEGKGNDLKALDKRSGQWDKERAALKAKYKTERDLEKHGPPSDDHKEAKALRQKPMHQLTNAELQKVNTRMQLERTHKDLLAKEINTGQKFTSEVMREVGKEMVKDYIKAGVKTAIKLAV